MPTTGHWYARDDLSAQTPGSVMRLAGGAALFVGAVGWAADEHDADTGRYTSEYVELALVGGGLAAMAAGIVVDIATTPSAVRRANEHHRRRGADRPAVDALGPLPIRGGGGLALAGHF
jgi:hypothetical protein